MDGVAPRSSATPLPARIDPGCPRGVAPCSPGPCCGPARGRRRCTGGRVPPRRAGPVLTPAATSRRSGARVTPGTPFALFSPTNQRAAFRREGGSGGAGGAAMAEARPLRLLALHGYRQSARRLRQRTGALRKALRGRAELVAIDAPHLLPAGAEDDPDGDDPPRGWWFSGPGTFEAGEAAAAPAGLEESLSAVAAALAEHGPFDGLLGFSQGAALAAMVCALRARGDPRFPVAFAVLVAGFASRAPAHGHFYREPIALPTLHVVGDTDAVIAAPLSRELAQCFVEPVVLTHPGGHFIPAAAAQKKAYLEFLERFCPGQGQAERPGAGKV
ncbi:esterase OVCA2 [Chamaea fasciata]|uniref:esterase OVCA2 n=1 Tax=Chamaea fasciata TaxID=190680 RepID=UPI00336AD117